MLIRPARPGDTPALGQLIGELGCPTSVGEMETRLAAIAGRSDFANLVADEAPSPA